MSHHLENPYYTSVQKHSVYILMTLMLRCSYHYIYMIRIRLVRQIKLIVREISVDPG